MSANESTEQKIDEILDKLAGNSYVDGTWDADGTSLGYTSFIPEAKQALLSLIAEERAHERKISRQLYAKRNPQYTKQWMADYLGISRPTLSKWLNDPEQFTLGASMKLQSLSTKQGE